jgi:hypothetical protein
MMQVAHLGSKLRHCHGPFEILQGRFKDGIVVIYRRIGRPEKEEKPAFQSR